MATTNVNAPKGAPKAKAESGFKGIKQGIYVIIICAVIAHIIFYFGAGSASNFQGGAEGLGVQFAFQLESGMHPHPDNLIGTVYLGGFIVPIIWSLLLIVLSFCIERFFAIRSAYGQGTLAKFVADIKAALTANDLAKAQAICDKQKGSVANVVGATLKTYKQVEDDNSLTKEQKVLAIQKSLEEATALEMPILYCRTIKMRCLHICRQ